MRFLTDDVLTFVNGKFTRDGQRALNVIGVGVAPRIWASCIVDLLKLRMRD